ncbi:Uma2 family endonuclease [Jiella endophytica]|uniref:Uma2 family endonuclease n=1 Tax=Jiella endophytica TaxID=2558362 RepID=A0A4Y8RH01_9HYPH|nr:Uma2 family endonuclease [Jiella endophytica]TFF20740.1 Uma2 family endonuclease [Jiella endophytica]TFF27041.1 Uma2 family endonuclease [Jiella endophytica]
MSRAEQLSPGPRKATYADLEAADPLLVAEIIDGELVTHPRPVPKHAAAASYLGAEILDAFGRGRSGPGGWIILDEPELHLGPDVIVPDIAGWRKERLSALPDRAYFDIAPDWVCEVISPSTERYDRNAKRRIYAEAGVKHMWLLDPRAELLETFALANGRWIVGPTFDNAAEVRAEPFDAIAFPLTILWPLDPAPDTQNAQ